jgi:hypothetical protein
MEIGNEDGEEVVPVLVADPLPGCGRLSHSNYELVVERPVLATLNED